MLTQKWSEKDESVQTSRTEIEDILPLCPLQESLLFHLVYDPNVADIYLSQTVVGLKGILDENTLKKAAAFLLDRHSSLRASFEFEGVSRPVQIILVQSPLVWSRTDLINVPPSEKEEKLRDLLAEDLKQPFPSAPPSLVRFKLIQLTQEEYRFVITSHHILFDGWSAMVMLKELLTAYSQNGSAIDLPPPTPYREYLLWLSRQDRNLAVQLWQESLSGLKEGTFLAPRLPQQSAPVHERHIEFLPEDLTLALVDSAHKHGVTLNAVIQTAWALLLGRMTYTTDVVFGGTVSGRPPSIEGIESMVGLFAETLPVRVEFRSTDRWIDLVKAVHNRQSRLMDYHYIGLAEIQRVSALTQLFDTLIVFQNYPVIRNFFAELASGLYVTSIQGRDDSHYPLSIMVVPGQRLELSFSYRVDAFSHSRICTIAEDLVGLLKAFLARPEDPVSLDASCSELQTATGYRLKGQSCDMPDVNGLADLIEAQVSRTPDRIAVLDGEQSFTYAEINQQANCLAHYLIDWGIGPEDMIAVILDRSIHAVLALLACLKCGGAYVPINPEYPPERIERILQLARPKVILSTSARKPAAERHSVCLLDEQAVMREIMGKPRTDPRQQDRTLPLDLNHPIYVIFTSGTTGVPKGVVMRAVAILNLMKWHDSKPHEGSPTNVAQFTSLGFDVSIQEILHSMSTGKTLHIVPETARHDPEEFVEWLERNDINLLFAPSLVIGALCIAAADKNIELKSLTDIIQGGEPLVITEGMRRQFASGASARRLHNHYGPSETHAVTAYRLPANPADWPSHVPIGNPIANMQMYVLNESLAPIQPGESGELYIAGVALARGYLNHPALTAERFVADPFGAPGDRMYRTGDLVSVNQAGMLEFIGRIDNQVKIGGVRIEPREIETALLRIEGILQCAVLVAEIQGKKQLAAYVVWQENRKSGIADIRQQLRRTLPEYMVPHRYCFVDKLPLTFNGKLDRNSLLALLDNEKYRAPQSKEEEILCNLYAEVLQTPKVGPEDDFFALGGDSLLATRLIGRLRSTFHLELNIRHLFEFPRICELAQQLQQQRKKQEVLVPQPRPERLPLSYGQQRLWFIDRLEGDSRKYNLMESLRLRGELNVTALGKAINTIVERHEILRTHFREVDGEPWQVIEPVLRIPIAFEDLREMAKEEKERKVAAAVESEAAEAFNLAQAPLLRIQVLRLEDQEHILLRTLHHIVSDGWSEGVFNRELMALYQAYCEGAENPLPPLPIQYADFTLWQRRQEERGELEEGLKYWKEKLTGIPEELNLAVEQTRRDVPRLAGDVQRSALSAEMTAQIKQMSQDAQATMYMTLLAAFVVLLARHSGQEDLVVGSPIANRQESKLEGLIGFFVNTLVMRVRAEGGTSFRKLLEEVKRTALEAYQYQDMPFDRLVAELSRGQWNRTPLFQVAFALQNAPWTFPAMRDVSIETLDNPAPLARYDLEVHGWEEGGKIQLFWLYRRGLFEPWRIRQMAGHYERILAATVGRPEERIDHIDLLSNEERDMVLYKWNNTAAVYPEKKCVHELFEEQAGRTPEAVAMVYEDQQLTYRELNRRGNQLAHYLRSLGVKPDARVGICVERGPEMIIGLLAVLKAGGAYVPLDPEYPDERLQFMLESSAPMVLLTQGQARERFKGMKEKLLVVNLNDAACTWADQPESSPSPAVTGLTPRNMAYVIYTSGSTGRPKAVMVEHRGVSNLITWVQREFRADDTDVVLQKSAFNFDASVWEIFLPLLVGGRLVMVAAGEHRDTNYLVRLIVRESVTIMLFIPSMVPFFLQEEGLEDIDSLRHVICGGEALSPQLLHLFFNHFHAQGRSAVKLNNFYGPTETTVGSLNWLCSPATLENVPIGRPISNTRAYVLDTQGKPVPVGLVGELYIGGAGVVRGYLNRAELTAERFVPDPFAGEAGARMYRTGDLARYQPDGNLEFLGRIDDQVKIRGFRVELGEIETVLREHELISDAAVAVRGDRDQPRLVGYVVRRAVAAKSRAANSPASDDPLSTRLYRESPGQVADSEFVRNMETYLKRRLPDYMVPSNIVLLESLPVGLNGKIDRRALPEPSNTAVHPYIAPTTLEERVLCRAFQELLGAPEVGIEDDFFELGGHSLLATRLTGRIRGLLGVNLPIRTIFEARTVRELSALVAFIRNGSTGPGIGAVEGVEEEL